MGREEGGEFRMGNTCIPVADSFRNLAKLIHFVKFKNKIKFKKKKNKGRGLAGFDAPAAGETATSSQAQPFHWHAPN